MVTFDKKKSNLNAFETQYLSNVINYLFLLFEMNVLSYLPPFYHNFENLTLYGIYEFLTPLPRQQKFIFFQKKIYHMYFYTKPHKSTGSDFLIFENVFE